MSGASDAPSTRAGFAAIVGWTNVGKSTLLNRLVGEKIAAVADVPQTTRNRILGVRTLAGRTQVVFVDTPGFHRPKHRLNRAMVDLARQSLAGVDVVLFLVDAARGLGPGDEEAASVLRKADARRLGVLNKVDLVAPKTRLLPMMHTMVVDWDLAEAFPVSALTGEGCDLLLGRVLELLPPGSFSFPDETLTDQTERALVAEWIRERLLHHTRQEIPHATAVVVDRWEETRPGLTSIEASIYVERESQKGIVIGKGGDLLKRVGTEAREEIERLLGRQIFLRLQVKVRVNWRDDERVLREIGLG